MRVELIGSPPAITAACTNSLPPSISRSRSGVPSPRLPNRWLKPHAAATQRQSPIRIRRTNSCGSVSRRSGKSAITANSAPAPAKRSSRSSSLVRCPGGFGDSQSDDSPSKQKTPSAARGKSLSRISRAARMSAGVRGARRQNFRGKEPFHAAFRRSAQSPDSESACSLSLPVRDRYGQVRPSARPDPRGGSAPARPSSW